MSNIERIMARSVRQSDEVGMVGVTKFQLMLIHLRILVSCEDVSYSDPSILLPGSLN